MQGFYVLLISLGIICVVLSFMLTEKLEEKSSQKEVVFSEDMLKLFLEKNEENLDQAIMAHAERTKEAALEETTRDLNRLTNEKIMAVDEFSDSVLEKISQNHSEVIFLYNMLNEKEKELKELISSVNQATNRNVAKTESDNKAFEKKPGQRNPKGGKKISKKDEKPVLEDNKLELTQEQKREESHIREEILKMHESGLSITDIAKKLNMGKGEIKLIIDLYQGARE